MQKSNHFFYCSYSNSSELAIYLMHRKCFYSNNLFGIIDFRFFRIVVSTLGVAGDIIKCGRGVPF